MNGGARSACSWTRAARSGSGSRPVSSPRRWVLTALAGNRLGSVEVLEHGLQRARDEFEERKLKHMAALLAYVFFEPQFTAGDAHR